jgi:uncharacterized protein YjeT (DUF2065 family)
MEQELKQANFRIGDLVGIGITLVVVGVVLSFGAKIFSNVKEDSCEATYDDGDCRACPDGYTYNTSGDECYETTNTSNTTSYTSGTTDESFSVAGNSSEGLGTLADNLPLIATIVVAAVVVGIIIVYMAGRISS